MLRPALLFVLSQAVVVWTDAEGVMHAGPVEGAPANARPLTASVSSIERDSRSRVLPDGGLREVDLRMWEGRLRGARDELTARQARVTLLERELGHQRADVCSVATTEAVSRAPLLVKTSVGFQPLTVNGQPVLGPEQRTTTTTRQCVPGKASPLLVDELAAARRDVQLAEAAVQAVLLGAGEAGAPL